MSVNSSFGVNNTQQYSPLSRDLNQNIRLNLKEQNVEGDTVEFSGKKAKSQNGIVAGVTALGAGVGAAGGAILNSAKKNFINEVANNGVEEWL